MNRTIRLFLIPILFFFGSSLQADTEIQGDIPVALAKVFMGRAFSGDSQIYSDIFDDFPAFTLPPDFEVVGSVRNDSEERAILRTTLGREEAANAVMDTLVADNWILIPPVTRDPVVRNGFVSRIPFSLPRQLCRNDMGYLSIYARDEDNGTLISLEKRVMRGIRSNNCEDSIAMSQRFRGSNGIGQYIPRMELPEPLDERNSYGIQPGGSRGSDYSSQVMTSITIDWPTADLHRHFTEQIVDQDWEEDVSAVSELMATSSWTTTVNGDIALLGKLTVIYVGDSTYELTFEIFRRNAGGGQPGRIVDVQAF